jgi:hypothetical protein
MNKEVVKTETPKNFTLTVSDAFKKKTDNLTVTDKKDILIPRILCMQGLSQFVADEIAQMGDLVSSVTGEVLSTKTKAVKFIPIKTWKTVVRSKVSNGQKTWVSSEEWDATKHTNLQWKEEVGGEVYENDEILNFYVILEKDLTNPAAFPHLLSFRRMSYKNGRKLVNHFVQCDMMQANPWIGTFELTTQKQSNDRGTFYIMDVRLCAQTDAKWSSKLQTWADMLSEGGHQVDADEDERPAAATQAVSDQF